MTTVPDERSQRTRVLWLSTIAFTLMFAVWLMLGVLGIPIAKELNLTDVQLGWLGGVAILAGSLLRFNFGVWTDYRGGRKMMTLLLLLTVIPTYWVSQVTSYTELLICAALFGLAGNSFTVGIAWNAAWFPREQQGLALGVFGAGNVGASVTKLLFGLYGAVLLTLIPATGLLGGLLPGGWRFYPAFYSVLLLGMAAAVWFIAPRQDKMPAKGRPFREMLEPLKHARVWQYSLHYVVVFGAYVALALRLPKYYKDTYGADLATAFGWDGVNDDMQLLRIASLLTAMFIFPASLLRPLGGYLSDRFGPRIVMYGIFTAMIGSGIMLSLPIQWSVWTFTAFVFVLGCGMGVGKAAVYKLIPEYFPREVGAVGGLVGMLGALGGFVLPPVWAYAQRWTGFPQTTFLTLLALTMISAVWFHLDVVRARKTAMTPELAPSPAST